MKVECITNKCQNLPLEIYKDTLGFSETSEFHIEIGQISNVYAIFFMKKNLWYLITVDDLIGPRFLPHQLFKILDGRISKYWEVKEGTDIYENNSKVLNFGFKEILEDKNFYVELIDDNAENIAVFNHYKKLIDNEY